jgi:very-short-patch-repair endonuclease
MDWEREKSSAAANERLAEASRFASTRREVKERRSLAARLAWAVPAHRVKMETIAEQRSLQPEVRARSSRVFRRTRAGPNFERRRREAVTAYWADPENRAQQSEAAHMRMTDPDRRRLSAEAARRQMASPEARQRAAEIGRRRMQDPDIRAAAAEAGRRASADPEVRRRMVEAARRRTASPEARRELGRRGKEAMANPASRRLVGEASKRRWADPDWAERTTLAARRGARARPTRPEKAVWGMLENLAPGDWRYNGDGREGVVIARKVPDFVCKRTRSLIEVFGTYYHQGQDPAGRINLFSRNGYRCLVIWDHELVNRDRVRARLASYVQWGSMGSPPREEPLANFLLE